MKTQRTFVRQSEHTDFMASRIRTLYTCVARDCGGAGQLIVSVPRLPKSLNHQYIKRGRFYDLDPDYKLLRDELAQKLTPAQKEFSPKGLLAAVIVFRSPVWLTKESTVRDIDIDNKVKPLLDAFSIPMGIRDSRFWAVHAFKELGPSDLTTLYVYDIGDIVAK